MNTNPSSERKLKVVKRAMGLLTVCVLCVAAVSATAWIGDKAGAGFVDMVRWFHHAGPNPVHTTGQAPHRGAV
jgi:hypothetical protein